MTSTLSQGNRYVSLSDLGGVITYPPPAYRSVEDLEAGLPNYDPDSSPLPSYRSQSFSYLSNSNSYDTESTHASQEINGRTRRSQSFGYLSSSNSNDTEGTRASQNSSGRTQIDWNNARRTRENHAPRVRKARRFPAFGTPGKITLILMVLVSAGLGVSIWTAARGR